MTRSKIYLWCLPALLVVVALRISPAGAGAGEEASDRLRTKRAAARIDSLIEEALGGSRLAANPPVDDATFARRTYVTVAGRIPAAAELESFLKSGTGEKSLRLVDDLLGAGGHESHLYNWYADLLRVKSRLPRRLSGEPYTHWLKESIAQNKPYDQLVRELLTAEGPVHKRGNGATGYLMRDRNMPEDNMSNTVRLFLGTRVECAQCHNHPFDKWSQKQYFEMVAFTGGIEYGKRPRQDPRAATLFREAQQRWGQNGIRALARTLEPAADGVYGTGTGATRLPKEYAYEDAKPLSWVTAHPMFAPAANVAAKLPDVSRLPMRQRRNPRALERMQAEETDSRTAFANWMTSPENDRFATVIANRVWKRLFGVGLIEPVDDIKDDTAAVAPALMAELTRLMIELKFDLRAFERVLLYTRHWRRAACVPAETPGTMADLRGPALRRMTAEQAWDSMLTLVVPDLDSTLTPALSPRAELVYREYDELANATNEELLERAGRLVLQYTDPEVFRQEQQKMRQERIQEMRREALSKATMEDVRRFRAGRALRDLQRASDLPSPAPPGHLLSDLGQSDRDLIESGHTDPTVPQVLALLNDFLEQRVLSNRAALIMRELGAMRDAKAQVRHSFVAILGRTPTDSERSMWERDVARGGNRAVQDLVWTLVNCHEFLFLQ